jgi:hypothetical protein
MNSERCLWINHLILQSRLHLHAFELWRFSQSWIIERLLSCSNLHVCISMRLHLHLLQVIRRSSSIFRIERTIAWSYDLRILYNEKRINWKSISFEST